MTEPAKKKKINQKRKHSEERRKEFNDHPVFQCFLCWVNSWVLLVRECRHCLPVEPWGSMAQQGWEQLSPPCHLCCRGEKEMLPPAPAGWASDPKHKQGTHRALSSSHWAQSSSGRGTQSFPLSLSHPAAAAGPKELWCCKPPLGKAVEELLLFLPGMVIRWR